MADYSRLLAMMQNGDEDSLDPQSAASAAVYKQMLSDAPQDTTDTQGIRPAASPIDLIAGGVGASIPDALSASTAAAARNRALAGMANPLDDLAALARSPQPAQKPLVAPDITAYRQTGAVSPRIEQALSQGDTAQKIVNALEKTPSTPVRSPSNAMRALDTTPSDTLPPNVYGIREKPTSYQEVPDKFANLADMLRKRKQ